MSNKANTTTPKPDGKPALTPELRFPGFSAPWQFAPLSKVLKEHKIKNTAGRDVFSVSMKSGIVNQIEHLGRSFAAADTSHYTVGRRFDVVYTKSPLKAFPFGVVKQCKFNGEVALSPLYGVFTPLNPHVGLLIEAYFESPNRSKAFLSPLCQKGAKNTLQITNTTFLSGRMPLPTQEPEQQKIAECLSSVDKLIAAQARKLDALKTHKKGLMQQLFPHEGETQPRLRFPEFQNVGEWEEKSFGKVLKITSGKGFKTSEYSKAGIRLLQIENVGYGVTKWNENAVYLPEPYAAEYPELVLRGGDIVLALNRPVTNGELKIAKIQKHEAIAILYQRVGRLEFLNGSLQVDFAFQLCRQFIKDFVITKSIGSDQPFISLMDLYEQTVLLPLPAEQQRIADCLTSLDDLIAAQTQKFDALKTHKKGLMQQLFPNQAEV